IAHSALTHERATLAEQAAKLELELAAAIDEARKEDLSSAAEQLADAADQARKQLDTAREAHRIELEKLKGKHEAQLVKLQADAEARREEAQGRIEASVLADAQAAHQAEL